MDFQSRRMFQGLNVGFLANFDYGVTSGIVGKLFQIDAKGRKCRHVGCQQEPFPFLTDQLPGAGACNQNLEDLDEVESDISAQRQEAKGRLRVNVPLSFGLRFIAPLIPGFTERYPMVDVELGLSDSTQNLFDGSWDLIFRVGYIADSDLRARRLGDSPMKVCASPDYLAKHGTPRRVYDLSSHNCLSYTLSPFQSKGFWAFGRHGELEIPVKGNLRADNGDALMAAAIRGQGIIYQPEFIMAEALANGELISLSLDHPPLEPGGLYVLFSPDRRLSLKVRAMIDYLVEVFSAEIQE